MKAVLYINGSRAGKPETPNFVATGKLCCVMHRRYLSCSVSRCAELPRSFDPSERKSPSPNSRPPFKPTPPKATPEKRRKDRQPHEHSFKLNAVSKHRFQHVKSLSPDRNPTRTRGIPANFFPTANATSYKLLRKAVTAGTVTEGPKDSRGGRELKTLLERHEARAMMLDVPKTSDTADLGLSDEVYQGVSYAPGTFIEARRLVYILGKFPCLSLFTNLFIQKRNSRSRNCLVRSYH